MKRIIKGILILLLCFVFVGCSKYTNEEEKKIQKQIEESKKSAEESRKLTEEYKKIVDDQEKSWNDSDKKAREITGRE